MDPFEHPSNSNFQLGIQQVKKELDSLDAAVRSRIIEISEVQNSIKECKAAKVDLELSIVREEEEVASLASQIKNSAWLVDERRRRRKACDESCEETKAKVRLLRSQMKSASVRFVDFSSKASFDLSEDEEERLNRESDERYKRMAQILTDKMNQVRSMRSETTNVQVERDREKAERALELTAVKDRLRSTLEQIQSIKSKPPPVLPPQNPPDHVATKALLYDPPPPEPVKASTDYYVDDWSDDDDDDIDNLPPAPPPPPPSHPSPPTVQNNYDGNATKIAPFERPANFYRQHGGGMMKDGSLTLYQPHAMQPPPPSSSMPSPCIQPGHSMHQQYVRQAADLTLSQQQQQQHYPGGPDDLVMTRHHSVTLREITRPIQTNLQTPNPMIGRLHNSTTSTTPDIVIDLTANERKGGQQGQLQRQGERRERVGFVVHETVTQVQNLPRGIQPSPDAFKSGNSQYPIIDWTKHPLNQQQQQHNASVLPAPGLKAFPPPSSIRPSYNQQQRSFQAPYVRDKQHPQQVAPPRSFFPVPVRDPAPSSLLDPSPMNNNVSALPHNTSAFATKKRKGSSYEAFQSDSDDEDIDLSNKRVAAMEISKKGRGGQGETKAGKKGPTAAKATTALGRGQGKQTAAPVQTAPVDFFGGGGGGSNWQPL